MSTSEGGVRLEARSAALAGFGVRLAGAVLDSLLLAVVTVPLMITELGWVAIALQAGYFTVLHSGRAGQTVGQRAVGIRVVRRAGAGQVGVGAAMGRWAASITVSALPAALGYLWMLWDPWRQTWHDKLAGTLVVYTEAVPPPASSLLAR